MRVGRVIISAVVGLAIVGGGTAGALKIRDNITENQKCESVKPQRATIHVSDARPRVAILGDSYTAGDGLDNRKQGWAYQIGTELAGVGRTGFVNGGYCGNDTYGERAAAVLALKPDTLIIQGGLNDWETPDKVQAAATSLLAKTASVPRVVILGPPDVPGRDGEAAVDSALKAAADAAHVQYVSTLHWKLDFLPDNTHLTPAGHAAFAADVADALKR